MSGRAFIMNQGKQIYSVYIRLNSKCLSLDRGRINILEPAVSPVRNTSVILETVWPKILRATYDFILNTLSVGTSQLQMRTSR